MIRILIRICNYSASQIRIHDSGLRIRGSGYVRNLRIRNTAEIDLLSTLRDVIKDYR
jgi:hypothetical protein